MSDNSFVIDIGEKYTRVADAHLKGKNIEIKSLGVVETFPNYFTVSNQDSIEKQAALISKLVSSLYMTHKIVNIVVPDTYSFSQVIEVPKLNERELQSAIRYQADQFIPLPIDDISLDLEIISEDETTKKSQVLTVASPKTLVSQIEKTIEYAGLIPDSLENELSVIRRLFSEVIKSPHQAAYLIVNFGYSSSSIYLFNLQNQLILSRNFKVGLELIIKDLKVNLNIDNNKCVEILKSIGMEKNSSIDVVGIITPIINELISEMNKFILLSKDRFSLNIEKIYIFNLDNVVKLLPKSIETACSIPVETLNLSGLLIIPSQLQSYSNGISSFMSAIAGNFR